MNIIYLYKKTHNVTGMNYLGKTSQDPFKYTGSGTYWKNHIKKHGNDVTTIILKECKDIDELKKWGIYYSELWNIVKSNEWANIRPESGDGGDTSSTPNYQKNKHLFSHAGESNPNYKHGKYTEEAVQSRLKLQNGKHGNYGKKKPPQVVSAIRKNFESQWGLDHNSGKHYYNDGVRNYLTYDCPDGCIPGMLPKNINKIQCEYCTKSVDNANYKRWHGEKCKLFSPFTDQSL